MMTVETITEHDQPGSEPGNPSPRRQADAGLAQVTAAIDQSALLTAISAGFVWSGSAVLSRTRLLDHSRARSLMSLQAVE
jgi:hypothetical protein